jgi:site-specific recombinase XerD
MALLKACSRRAPTGVRNAALIVVLYRTGLRIGEALALVPKDVDLSAGTVNVLHGKGDKSRVVGIDADAAAVLDRWLLVRAKLGIPRSARLFCTLKAGAIEPRYVRAMLPRLARRAGLEKRIHAHGLRHAFAVSLVREHVELPVISKALGHSSSAVTSRYVDHIHPAEVIETMRARPWAA